MDELTFSVWSGWTLDDAAQITAACGPTTFIISVCFAEIERTSWGRSYLKAIGRLTSDDHEDAQPSSSHFPPDPLLARCRALMLELAPVTSIQGLPIEELCSAPIYRLSIVSTGAVDDDGVRIAEADPLSYGPSHDFSPMPVGELPISCSDIPRVPARTLRLVTADGEADPRAATSPQGRVLAADGSAMYFKPRLAGREGQFQREAQILGRIAELGLYSMKAHRFSRLLGIVVTGEHAELAVGIVLKLIPIGQHGGDCLRGVIQKHTEMHELWKTQVVAMVEALHAHGLVWGDVNAGNVVIDDQSNAWVIDFGGLNNPEFVDDGLAETEEGDRQGIGRLFDEWLLHPSLTL